MGKPANGGSLYNSMIAPFAVGPMALKGAAWYQGESNVGGAAFYSCAFPSMISRWRQEFQNENLWFGFVQIAGFRYSVPMGHNKPEIDHSHHAGDLRQAQLSALSLPFVGMTTTVDTGDWTNIHPPDKQYPAKRLARQALSQVYGHTMTPTAEFPLYAGSSLSIEGNQVTVTVAIRAGGKPVRLTSVAPEAATQSSTLGKGTSIPRNQCITVAFSNAFPQDCGYPAIIGTDGTSLNATAAVGEDGSSIRLSAIAPEGFQASCTSYGRASWPMTVFFDADTQLPVIPWYANFTVTNPYTPPTWNSANVALQEFAKSVDQERLDVLSTIQV